MAEINIVLETEPFLVPDCVVVVNVAERPLRGSPRRQGTERMLKLPMKYMLADVDVDSLHAMCEEFAESVFLAAGKNRPPR